MTRMTRVLRDKDLKPISLSNSDSRHTLNGKDTFQWYQDTKAILLFLRNVKVRLLLSLIDHTREGRISDLCSITNMTVRVYYEEKT